MLQEQQFLTPGRREACSPQGHPSPAEHCQDGTQGHPSPAEHCQDATSKDSGQATSSSEVQPSQLGYSPKTSTFDSAICKRYRRYLLGHEYLVC